MELDMEDFIEEVKFQMTMYDILEEKLILEWESGFQNWIRKNKKNPAVILRGDDDFRIRLRSEEQMEKAAGIFYKAVKNNNIRGYWKMFRL